ncbi:beta-N-acetylhexosaminidase [Parabacteroides faecis]|uniref:beta-N-acetylhexosaminidase n=1 Tax=Parabacteroides faecis TaxID=1217282 RepID=UPI002164B614|nr:beta-N-acetylhexosaminidase [Parabacteroides faecis]MCS2891094.1 beta-N-acetylhexosaminidase [Parabacteroides faecis]UVQ45256.1 beta-N-acetylhexosaminidase [Parabacteroides faecis]
MKIRLNIFLLCCLLGVVELHGQKTDWTLPTPDTDKLPTALIPYPDEVIRKEGVTGFSVIKADKSSLEKLRDGKRIGEELNDVCMFWNMPERPTGRICRIYFEQLPAQQDALKREAYKLVVSDDKVVISAGEFAGFFNALQTLRQLVKETPDAYELPNCVINDSPAFSIRGIMLDVGRNCASAPFIKEVVRKLSYYKINLLHLHLTDDPGWRIEVKNMPELTAPSTYWKTRQPGKYYTQDELSALDVYCSTLNMRVVPEVDMPGHSAYFEKATGLKLQTPEGMAALQKALDEVIPLFKDSLFHIGSDEVRFEMDDFMPEMIKYIRSKGKEVVTWYPGYSPDKKAVRMCWGENEAGHILDKSAQYIDSNGFYMDYMDSQGGMLQTFFQQPCEVPAGNENALGSIMCVWTDGALSSEKRLLEQYPFYPCMLTFAERIWRGTKEKRRDLMAQFPSAGTPAWTAISEFEDRLVYHRDHYFRHIPFPYVKQADIKWRLIGPFDHQGVNDRSFEPEKVIKKSYTWNDTVFKWTESPVYGGEVQIRSFYAMFNAHQGKYRLDHWPTTMSPLVGKEGGTCYAVTYIKSPVDQDVYLMFGLNGMWGHSGGYRTARAPEQGSWDFSGGDIWLNDERVSPPHWPFESLPWTGWGQGRIETPLTEEGYFYRPPVKIKLKKGLNKVLVRSVFGHWKGDDGQRKWQFCCIPVQWDGMHYTEVPGLEFVDWIE